MNGAEKKIFDLIQNKSKSGFSPIKDVLIESISKLEELYNRKQHITGVATGFSELDYMTTGLHGSELILLAARPAMGKSAFALNIAANAAIKANIPVAIFNLEMSKEQLVDRILSSEAMVDSNKIRTGKLEIIQDDEKSVYAITEGLINVKKDGVVILVNSIERKDEIDIDRAKEAKRRAEERLNKPLNIDVERAQKALIRANNRISVYENE